MRASLLRWIFATAALDVVRSALAVDPRTLAQVAARQSIDRTSSTTSWKSVCEDFSVPVHVSRVEPGTFSPDVYNATVVFALAERQILIPADYSISVRLCYPAKGAKDQDIVQVLVHGATFNKHMWDFPYQPDTYSWTKRMNEAGHTTLAIDLVSAGNSSTPNGLYEAHTETMMQVTRGVIQKLKSGALTSGRKYHHVTIVGFSIGGIIANALADKYPDDVDSLVLLGISWDLTNIYPAFLSGLQQSAQLIDPKKWGHLPLTYQTHATLGTREIACFAGQYDRAALETDFALRDMDTLGAAITFTYHLVTAKRFSRPVFLGVGELDGTFCGRKCTTQPRAVYERFPAASDHTIRVYPKSGHAVMFHPVAPQLHRDVLTFLQKHS